mgnify:CR=1 FL=1
MKKFSGFGEGSGKKAPMNFNAGLRAASKAGKLDNNPKFKAAVDNAPMKKETVDNTGPARARRERARLKKEREDKRARATTFVDKTSAQYKKASAMKLRTKPNKPKRVTGVEQLDFMYEGRTEKEQKKIDTHYRRGKRQGHDLKTMNDRYEKGMFYPSRGPKLPSIKLKKRPVAGQTTLMDKQTITSTRKRKKKK